MYQQLSLIYYDRTFECVFGSYKGHDITKSAGPEVANILQKETDINLRELTIMRTTVDKISVDPTQDAKLAEKLLQSKGEIHLQLRKKKYHRFRKYYAVLTKGFLSLFTNKQDQHYKYHIDLAKVSIKEEEKAIILEFRVESRALIPVNEKDFVKWKEAIIKHQHYRKSILQKKLASPTRSLESEKSSKGSVKSVKSTPTTYGFNELELRDSWVKKIDEIQQTQGLTIEVLDRMAMTAIQMRKIAEVLNQLTAVIQKRETLSKETRSKLAASITSALNGIITMEISMVEVPYMYPFACEVDTAFDAAQSSFEYDGDILEQTSTPPMILHSLKATTNVEQRRAKVVQRTLECLGKKALPSPNRSDVPSQPSDSVVALLLEQRQEVRTQSGGQAAPTPATFTTEPSPTPAKALGRMILQRTGVPITHYEPLTALQLLCEEMRYSKLLDRACTKPTAEERMVYVAAFAVSPYPNSTGRFRKFFNPLLGETYEYEQEDFRYHAEQVGHHPAVSAGHATGNGWTWFQTFSAEVTWNAWAQTCEFAPERPVRLQLNGEEYSWNKITTHIENLVYAPEQRTLYHEGTIKVKCSNGVSATIHVDKNKDLSGEVVDSKGETFCKFSGKWDESFVRETTTGEKEQLIVVASQPIHPQYFGFSDFTMGLNELYPEDRASLPPTDSRLRPDVRNLEDGKLDNAVAYKYELEKAQRARNINEETYKPLWFVEKMDEFANKKMYVTNGKYWEAKEAKFEQQKKDNAFIPIFNVSITN